MLVNFRNSLTKASAVILISFLVNISAKAEIIHEFDVGTAGNLNTIWRDSVGQRDLTGFGNITRVIFTNDPRVSLSRAYTASNANLNIDKGLATAKYTLEFWIHLDGSVAANEVIFETGGGSNGLGLFTKNGSLELATSSIVTGADALAEVSLRGLDLNHFIQVIALFDTSANSITLIAKDINGVEITSTSSSQQPLFIGVANGMGLFSGGNGNFDNRLGAIGGSGAQGMSLKSSSNVFSGKIGLFRIYSGLNLAATDASFQTRVLPAARISDSRPNFIVIFTDDHGYADVSAQGQDPNVQTPFIDQLAREGVRFTDGYVTSPQCVPSRAGLVSGQYQDRFGVDENSFGPMDPKVITVPERLRNAGYRTGMIGKWHLDPNRTNNEWASANGINPNAIPESVKKQYYPDQQGFEEFAFGPKNSYWRNFNRDGSDDEPLGVRRNENNHRIDIQSDFAESFIERNHNRPFFLYLSYFAPHVPLEWVDRYRNTFNSALPEKRRIALGMIKAIDDGVGRVLAKLSEHQIDEQTIIWFIGDNGAPLGFQEPGNIGATDASTFWDGSLNTPWLGEKGMLSEGGIRVPWFMRWKGTLIPQVYHQPVISLDVGATAHSLSGLIDDPTLDGVNLIPYLKGSIPSPPHDSLYWRFWNQSAVRSGKWKYIRIGQNIASFLFNLESDEHEKVNLIDQFPDIANLLDNKLEGWKSQLLRPDAPNSINGQEAPLYRYNFGFGDPNFDSDADGVINLVDRFPGNPTEWLDSDEDGIGNNADVDDDNDGLPDSYEIANKLDPLKADSLVDSDNDGFSNLEEFKAQTNPNDPKSHPANVTPWLNLLLD